MSELLAQVPAAVRVGAFFVVWIIGWMPIAIPLAVTLQWRPLKPLTVQQKLPLVASLYAIAPLILWGFAYVEHQPFSELGLTWNWALVAAVLTGIGLAVAGLIALFVTQQLSGWIVWRSEQVTQLKAIMVPTLMLGLWVSVIEELVFRGFLINQFQREYPLWIAAGLSSLIFALLHLVWEGKAIAPQLPGLWLMGMVLVLARWVSAGSLGLAIGLHAGWIWGIASLDSAQMVQYTEHSPSWMTGIANKPLAGLLGLLLLAGTGSVIWAIAIATQRNVAGA